MILLYILLGVCLGIVSYIYIPKFVKKYLTKPDNSKYFDITFKLVYFVEPSIYHHNTNAELIKTDNIKMKIKALDKNEALNMLEEIVHQEIKLELTEIKDLGNNG